MCGAPAPPNSLVFIREKEKSMQNPQSLGSYTGSEFELVHDEKPKSECSLEDHPSASAPPLTFSLQDPKTSFSEREMASRSIPAERDEKDSHYAEEFNSLITEFSISDLSVMGKETVDMLDKLVEELNELKKSSHQSLYDCKSSESQLSNSKKKRVDDYEVKNQINEWKSKAHLLKEENKVLQKRLLTANDEVQKLMREVEGLRFREEKLFSCLEQIDQLKDALKKKKQEEEYSVRTGASEGQQYYTNYFHCAYYWLKIAFRIFYYIFWTYFIFCGILSSVIVTLLIIALYYYDKESADDLSKHWEFYRRHREL